MRGRKVIYNWSRTKIIICVISLLLIMIEPSILLTVEADGDGILNTSFTWEGFGGYVARGVGTWGNTTGNITLQNIPSGASIEKAYIYWVCNSDYGLDSFIYINGQGVNGNQIGRDGPMYSYRANITSLVTGNGDYEITDITNAFGASIVTIYSESSSDFVKIIINDGMDTEYNNTIYPHWLTETIFSGFKASSNPKATVTYILGDGQTYYQGEWRYDKYSFNSNVIAENHADGSDGNPTTHGWDTDTYDVSSYVSQGDTTATANIYEDNDELLWAACVFSVTLDPPFLPPIAYAGPDQTVNEGEIVQFDARNSKGSTSGPGQVWTKYAGNPVLDISPSGSWDDAYVTHPSVLFDGTTYHMWYSGYDSSNWRMGYANSSDGITWVKNPTNPIIDLGAPGSWEDTHITHPTVLYDGTTYHMWYSGHDGVNYRIGYASSLDGITWSKYPGNPVLDWGPSGSWDDFRVDVPMVTYDGVTFHMWYSGHDGFHFRIGYAYSSDGTTWFKSAANPVIDLGSLGSWDDFHVYSPSIIYDGITYYMWYSGHDGSNWRIGYATSSDGIDWIKDGSNPFLDIGPSGSWEDVGVHYPTVMYSGGYYHMWYSGFSGTNVRIGYAYSSAGGQAQIVSYEWDFDANVDSDGDGNPANDVDAIGPTPTHIYGDDGVFNVTLRITDDQNLTDTDTCNIKVLNVAPIIDPIQEYTINEFENVTLIGYATDPGSDDLTFTWNWGYVSWGDKTTTYYNDGFGPDPYPSPEINPRNLIEEATCQYGDNGVFTVTLTVSDDDGGSTIILTNITVNNIAPIASIQSATMNVEISLRVAGSKWSNVGLTLYENDTEIGYLEVERWPGSPDENPTYENPALPTTLDMTKSYKAIVTYDPYPDNNDEIKGDQPNNGKDKQNNAGNPVWIIMKFNDGSEEKIHHTFNTQQSKKRNSKHWNHLEPWEINLNTYLKGYQFEVTSHVDDPGSDDITLTYIYGSQIVNVTYLNNPPNTDPYPSPEINPRDIKDTISLTYEGPGTLELTVIDDGGTAVVDVSLY